MIFLTIAVFYVAGVFLYFKIMVELFKLFCLSRGFQDPNAGLLNDLLDPEITGTFLSGFISDYSGLALILWMFLPQILSGLSSSGSGRRIYEGAGSIDADGF